MSQLLQVSHVGVHTGSGNQQFGNGVGVGVGKQDEQLSKGPDVISAKILK
jgi:hypothetical protein